MRLKTPCFVVTAGLLACASSGPLLADQLRILNILGGDNVVVMTASVGRCRNVRNVQVLRTTGQLPVGNVLPAEGCNSEIAVFAENNAMEWITPVKTWTGPIPLRPIIEVPVRVWVATTGAGDAPNKQVDTANTIYRKNKVGVKFVATYEDVSDDAAAVERIGNSCHAIGAIRDNALHTRVLYKPRTLNIYYVNGITNPPELQSSDPSRGLTCDRFGDDTIKGDANIIFIDKSAHADRPDQADYTTLAHEIGHAFGLRPGYDGGHMNSLQGFRDESNVMWTQGGANRDRFTLGQVFRMNTQLDEWGGSMLIANGLRPGPGRACPLLFESDRCPPLALDWP